MARHSDRQLSPPPLGHAEARRVVMTQDGRAQAGPEPSASVMGLLELCHDLKQEVVVMAVLVDQLEGSAADLPVVAALRTQVEVLQSTLREAQLHSPPRELHLRPLVQAVADTTRLVHTGAIRVDAPDEGVVLGVASEVRRALVNLIDNARGAAPRGTIRLGLREEGEDVLLVVEDDGSGEGAAGGTGLGLAIVRDVAHRHGGSVLSRPGATGGLAVTLRLPRLGG